MIVYKIEFMPTYLKYEYISLKNNEDNFTNPLLQVGSGSGYKEKSNGSRSSGPKINGSGSSSLHISEGQDTHREHVCLCFHENGFLDHDGEPDLVRLGPQLLDALILAVVAACFRAFMNIVTDPEPHLKLVELTEKHRTEAMISSLNHYLVSQK